MANEITSLCGMPKEERGGGSVLALATQQAYQVSENGFQHLFEISCPSYVGGNKDTHNRLIAFGEFSGTSGTTYVVKITSGTTFQYSVNGGSFSGDMLIRTGPISLTLGVQIAFQIADGEHLTNDQWTIYVDRCWLNDDGNFNKFQTITWNHGVWFLNRLNKLKFIQGNTIQNIYQSCRKNIPSGVYLEEFYGHIFVGRPTYEGSERKDWIIASHLNDPSEWTPNKINEASYYEYDIDVVTGEQPVGITGMKKLRDWLLVYTPSKIFYVEYIGLDAKGLVYQRKPLIDGIGSAFSYGVIGNDLYHFFWTDENCYLIDGTHQRTMLAMPQTIGDDIKEFFFVDLHPNPIYRDMTWAYIDRFFNEVHWVYVSVESNGTFDKELVYNFKEKIWSSKTTDLNICSRCEVALPETLQTYADLSGEFSSYNTQFGNWQQPSSYIKRVLYGASDLQVVRDEVTGDVPSDLIPFAQNPFLESQDEIYGSLNEVKHVDGLIIHGTYDPQTCQGIRVYVAARFSVSDPLNYQLVATWQNPTEYGLFSFPRLSGRVFRYKFEAAPRDGQSSVRSVTFNAWAEYVFGIKKEVEK